jgi:hypothetical protein
MSANISALTTFICSHIKALMLLKINSNSKKKIYKNNVSPLMNYADSSLSSMKATHTKSIQLFVYAYHWAREREKKKLAYTVVLAFCSDISLCFMCFMIICYPSRVTPHSNLPLTPLTTS